MLPKRKGGGHGPSYPWSLPDSSVRRTLTGGSELPTGTARLAPGERSTQRSSGRDGGRALLGGLALGWPRWLREQQRCVWLPEEVGELTQMFQSFILLSVSPLTTLPALLSLWALLERLSKEVSQLLTPSSAFGLPKERAHLSS